MGSLSEIFGLQDGAPLAGLVNSFSAVPLAAAVHYGAKAANKIDQVGRNVGTVADVMTGAVDPMSDQSLHAVTDLAMDTGLGSYGASAALGDGVEGAALGTLMGPKGLGYKHEAANAAREMMDRNPRYTPLELERATSTAQHGDNVYMQEFSDHDLKPKVDLSQIAPGKVYGVSDLFSWPGMERNYPELLKDTSITLDPALQGHEHGWFAPGQKRIGLNYGNIQKAKNVGLQDLWDQSTVGTVNHEGQHMVSNHEGAAVGGSPESIARLRAQIPSLLQNPHFAAMYNNPNVSEDALRQSLQVLQNTPDNFKAYQALLDEIRARAAQSRRALTPNARGILPITKTMEREVAPAKRIILPHGSGLL